MKLSVIRQSFWLRINYIDLSPEISDFYRCCIQFFAEIKYRCCGLLDFRLLSKIYVDKSGSFDYNTKAIGVWLSLVERLVRDQEAGGSSPLTPTSRSKVRFAPTFFMPMAKNVIRPFLCFAFPNRTRICWASICFFT